MSKTILAQYVAENVGLDDAGTDAVGTLLIEEALLVRAALESATTGFDSDTAGFTATTAKAQASASAAEIARMAHQMHGAIGVTELSAPRFATTRNEPARRGCPVARAAAAAKLAEIVEDDFP